MRVNAQEHQKALEQVEKVENMYNSEKFAIKGFEGKSPDEIVNQKSRKELI